LGRPLGKGNLTMKLTSIAVAALAFAVTTPALAGLSGLDGSDASNELCHPEPFAGKIAKRIFDDTRTRVSWFVVESSDGTREGINVNTPPPSNLVERDNVAYGLQTLTRIGRFAHGTVYRCGASGHFLYLDAIR
jgi:hypothetical protein